MANGTFHWDSWIHVKVKHLKAHKTSGRTNLWYLVYVLVQSSKETLVCLWISKGDILMALSNVCCDVQYLPLLSYSYFLSGPFVCRGLCLRHFLDELAESPRLRQQRSSLGRGQKSWAERDWGPEPRSRGPGQRPMQLLVAAWPSELTETATMESSVTNIKRLVTRNDMEIDSYFFSVLLQLLPGGVKLWHELSGSETVRRDTLRHCDWIVAKLEEKLWY